MSEFSQFPWRRSLAVICILVNSALESSSMCLILPFFASEMAAKDPSSSSSGSPTVLHTVTLGCVFSVSTLASLVASILLAGNLPKLGSKFVLLLSGITTSSIMVLFSFLHSIDSWTVFLALSCCLRAVQGVCQAGVSIASFTLLTYQFPTAKGFANGAIRASISFGFALGPLVGGTTYDLFGFAAPFYVTAAMVLLSVLAILLLLPGADQHGLHGVSEAVSVGNCRVEHEERTLMNMKLLCRRPWLWLHGTSLFLVSATCGFLEPTLPGHMKRTFGEQPVTVGLAFCVYSIAFLISPLVGVVGDQLRCHRLLLVMGLVFSAVSCQIIGPAKYLHVLKPSLRFLFLGMSLLGLGGSLSTTSAPADVLYTLLRSGLRDSLELNAAVGGVVDAVSALGYGAGPLIGSSLVSLLDFPRAISTWGMLILFYSLITVAVLPYSAVERCNQWSAKESQRDGE